MKTFVKTIQINYEWDDEFILEFGGMCKTKSFAPINADLMDCLIGTVYAPNEQEGYNCYGADIYDNKNCDIVIEAEDGFETEAEAKAWVEWQIEKLFITRN